MKLALIGRHIALRFFSWRWCKPIARTLLVAGGLLLLALLGRSTLAGATAPTSATADIMGTAIPPAVLASATQVAADAAPPPPVATPAGEAAPAGPRSQSLAPATPEDPVFLNQANADDLRRLPGIGQKRALAILTLRTKVGRFRQVEDLMRVKGIGRATLKKLRPLVKLDLPAPSPAADAGPTTGPT
jgi:competence protein ComEA